jgi:hypothetical protein
LMVDLMTAGVDKGWVWATGRTLRGPGPATMQHSWLEFDGWAFDVAGGRIICVNAYEYRRGRKAASVKLRDAEDLRRWLRRRRTDPV